ADLIGTLSSGSIFLVSAGSGDSPDIDSAREKADLIRDRSLDYGLTFADASAFGEDQHPLFRSLLASFLGIRDTGWSALYIRDKETVNSLEPFMASRMAAVPDDVKSRPFIFLSHSSGSWAVLEAERDFSGRVPSVLLGERSSEVYGWIPIFEALEGTVPEGGIDFHLTSEGTGVLADLGLNDSFPLLLRKSSLAGDRLFFSLPVRSRLSDPGNPERFLKEWYFGNIAQFRPGSQDKLFWKIYMPVMKTAIEKYRSAPDPPPLQADFRFRADLSGFSYEKNGKRENLFIKGVNLGSALPGFWSTEFPEDEELYLRWFASMKEMNLNTVRIYTLYPPAFYRALALFNWERKDDPLFLIQEIWPEEHPAENNLMDSAYVGNFEEEIRMNIDALHGKGSIGPREGRAWGHYTRDVSPWLTAWLIGRELEPEEILETDRLNGDQKYSGTYISASGSAGEAWLAAMCDYAAVYEKNGYSSFRPVGIVSWPTLDPLPHPYEWTDPELMGRAPYNDSAEVDINHFSLSEDFTPGFFGAYHIYPNYPDFMNNEESYGLYRDEEGSFRYGGYLKQFMEQHRRFPALVAEYGISTSLATAHYNPDGYNHGGMSETEQAGGIIRMAEAIKREGYAGAIIFEWADEWAKKTWTTEPFMIPYDRQANWHNVLDPEQNYGIIAMESAGKQESRELAGTGSQLSVSSDESYLMLEVEYKEGDRLLLGLDTYDRNRGSVRFPDSRVPETQGGMEFIVETDLSGSVDSLLLALKSYNLGQNSYSSAFNADPEFLPVSMLINRSYRDKNGRLMAARYADWSVLPQGDFSEGAQCIRLGENCLEIRIPWGLLNVSDPSGLRVLDDEIIRYSYPLRDTLQTAETGGVVLYGVLFNEQGEILSLFPSEDGKSFSSGEIYTWESWNVPQYREVPKKSYELLKEYFAD
ncbi:MAG: hypothetical protein JXR86_13755, partial [Spirochaetales bacterium]|nr:hypothetical protein [Spirochaetales bacterium]